MIATLTGKVKLREERMLVLDVNGTGYFVHATRSMLEKISEDQELELFIHTQVREDDISLYGFPTKDEWKFFRLLITVSGVGPKSALEILNSPFQRVKQAIAKKDSAYLTQIHGIGRKTAERIIIDLEGKVKEQLMEERPEEGSGASSDDMVQALVSLGYSRNQVILGLKKIPAEIAGEEAVIKYFLQNI